MTEADEFGPGGFYADGPNTTDQEFIGGFIMDLKDDFPDKPAHERADFVMKVWENARSDNVRPEG
jgi:hypothetical protein